jgi:hypothetical protein
LSIVLNMISSLAGYFPGSGQDEKKWLASCVLHVVVVNY